MPLYYFDTDDGDTMHRDTGGQNLPDAEAARCAALDALPDMARDKMPGGDSRTFIATARDQQGNMVYVATLTLKGERRSGFAIAS